VTATRERAGHCGGVKVLTNDFFNLVQAGRKASLNHRRDSGLAPIGFSFTYPRSKSNPA
jgi:hypothetical protein